ncbi:esterase-like activity of phytase family protein [Maridesulfovibrio hydrothermalis]|uniref:Phytase-like domain-containing protein n=1 Tax=Maridesulfovibrio hydrothermalis AM13 = DSM 14728 TaxID=1121451 RepID=L0RHA9_9BACT|nr:esterase-like activity of phytase family protein [Maridesulfovibrio hydrothermalis]CCO24941.1 conserved exported protein of unknown function [Maridesulfovibrio hydrothermalis AM13 = DSM 14728]
MKKNIIFVIILCFAPITLLFGASTKLKDSKQPIENPITVKLVSNQVGPHENDRFDSDSPLLKYKGTLLLHSPHPAFGGFSDLLISNDRKSFLAITDMGFWLKADLNYTSSGFLEGVSPEAKLGQLLNTRGETFAIKYSSDAEGLSRAAGSGFLVSYERVHRINYYNNAGKFDLSGTASKFKTSAQIKELPENGGIETLLLLADERLFVMAEGDPEFGSLSYAAVTEKNHWTHFNYQRTQGFRPTSAGNLPDGEILVLERRYNGPGTLGIRFRKFKADAIKSGATIVPETFFELKPPLPRDNFEGLDTVITEDGRTYIYIISDDNFSPVQRTIITMFELLPKA